MLPKRTCPSCDKKAIKFASIMKNIFITDEGSRCTNCHSLILVNQSYKQVLKYPFVLLSIVLFLVGVPALYEPFIKLTEGSFLDGTLFLVFLNMIVVFSPIIVLVLIYCYYIPIVPGTEEEITKRDKVITTGYLIKGAIFVIVLILIYYWSH